VVQNLSITAGDNAGELNLQSDPAAGAKSYEVQVSPDPIMATSWTSEPSVTKSRTAISGLMSGEKMWARVRAIGPGGTAHGAIRHEDCAVNQNRQGGQSSARRSLQTATARTECAPYQPKNDLWLSIPIYPRIIRRWWRRNCATSSTRSRR